MSGSVTVVDLSDYCPQCMGPWKDHPKLDAQGRDPDGNLLGDPGEAYCRKRTGASAPTFVRKLRWSAPSRLFAWACIVMALTLALVALSPVSAAGTTTGTWIMRTYSDGNQTQTFSYPGTVNMTLQPVNLTVSGQRSVSIADAANATKVYFSTSIGFYPAGSNFTTGKVNVSWAVPEALQNGAVLMLSVGLTGVKTAEGQLLIEIQANLTHLIGVVMAPVIAGLQGQIGYLQQQLKNANDAAAANNFQNQQIEAFEGVAIAGLIGYILYDKRKKAGRTEEYQKSGTEVDGVIVAGMMEAAEPGEKPGIQAAANGGSTNKGA